MTFEQADHVGPGTPDVLPQADTVIAATITTRTKRLRNTGQDFNGDSVPICSSLATVPITVTASREREVRLGLIDCPGWAGPVSFHRRRCQVCELAHPRRDGAAVDAGVARHADRHVLVDLLRLVARRI